MTSRVIRRVSAGLAVAGLLALVPSLHAQRDERRAGPAPSEAIVPFKIQVPDSVLTDLKERLSRARFPEDMGEPGWDYGTNQPFLRSLIEHWRDRYDWRAQEKRFNQFDQFTTNIDGVAVYFIHQRSRNPNARPLLLLNGWPSSILEYTKVIEPLTDPAAFGGRAEDGVHVIIPSMPGYGFSGKPRERGYSTQRMAEVHAKLMARLGYTDYIVHGSDWGPQIGRRMALTFPQNVAALHIVGCGGGGGGTQPPLTGLDARVDAAHTTGYQQIQSTKPHTLGPAMSDSPVGLASWIVEKWHGWSDHDGAFEKKFTNDELLTTIMIYWVTNSLESSARLYYEARHITGTIGPTPFPPSQGRVSAPTGCVNFGRRYDRRGTPEINIPEARKGAEAQYNVVHFTVQPRGGHFPAYEEPELWLEDIRTFLRIVK